MVSVDMAAQVLDCASIEPETSVQTSDEIFLDIETHAKKSLHKKDQFNPVDDYAPKTRKPYTITKQRERWTDDEHKKFLEALRLYGRAWRKIEEHVGSKTAVQIRSHAQKFFSKVARDPSDAADEKPIEIPPPRPKKKPTHPYPRKYVCPIKTGASTPDKPTRSASSSLSASEPENQSAKSMLSTVGSHVSIGANPSLPNGSLSPSSGSQIGSKYEHLSAEEDTFLELELFPQGVSLTKGYSSETDSSHHLRLFGKTLLVTDHHSPLNTTSRTCKLEFCRRNEETCFSPFGVSPVPIEVHPSCSEYIWSVVSQRLPMSLYCGSIENDLFYTQMKPDSSDPQAVAFHTRCKKALWTQEVRNPIPVKALLSSDMKETANKDEEKDASSTGSNTDLCCTTAGEKTNGADSYPFERIPNEQSSPSYKLRKQLSTNSVNSGKGFVPYQRCLGKRASALIPNGTADEPKHFRARLSL